MIKVKHPLHKCNVAQEAMISQLPDEQRRYHELLFSYGNATYRYHERAIDSQPTHKDYEEWLEGLPHKVAVDMAAKGFEECRTILSFTRYVNEKNDIGMDEYVRELMGEKEYQEYKDLLEW